MNCTKCGWPIVMGGTCGCGEGVEMSQVNETPTFTKETIDRAKEVMRRHKAEVESERIQHAKEISFQLLRRMRIECCEKIHSSCLVHTRPDEETDKADRVEAGEIVDRMVREGTLWTR